VTYPSLREYGLVGNHDTAALVSRHGSLDWLCQPYLDSPSVFAALLDANRGGHFEIRPQSDYHSEQSYVPRTLVLETRFETPNGRGILTDWMPVNGEHPAPSAIHRRVTVLDGQIRWVLDATPRFEYGSEGVEAERHHDGILFRGMQPGDLALLESNVPLRISENGRSAIADFTLGAGQEAQFCWSWGRQWGRASESEPFPSAREVIQYWRAQTHQCGIWGGTCPFAGPWHDLVDRSALLIRMLCNQFAGSLAESVTTSLPSLLGGTRNWDHRYTWLRESALAIQAMQALGQSREAERFFQWLSDIVARDGAEGLQPVYSLDGGRYLPERELPLLSGYAGSRPVRVGNLSARQFQLDIYGHVMLAAYQHYESRQRLPDGLWPALAEIAEHVCQAWRRPDRGPWEVRSKPEHFVASKVLCWVALDRAITLAEMTGERIPMRWREERKTLHRTICEQGFDHGKNAFIRAFGDRDLDSAALLIPLLGFLPANDPRVRGTLDAVQSELSDGVLIHRYRSSDGLPESDGAHLICSFWLVSCLALSGRVDEAADRLAELCTYATPIGLFGEQVDPSSETPAGNFPSAAAHLALINAALHVGLARARRPSPFPLIGAFDFGRMEHRGERREFPAA
jgi:GH15 family glucan-1,4-alpha-glucosidase